MADAPDFDQMSCPVPMGNYEHVLLGHGSGGKLSADLIERLFLPAFGDETLVRLEDQATLHLNGESGARIAFTTDSYVVRPLFFPGGDIGKLAVHGTINDLAVGVRRRCFCPQPLSSKKDCQWSRSDGSPRRCVLPAMKRACAL